MAENPPTPRTWLVSAFQLSTTSGLMFVEQPARVSRLGQGEDWGWQMSQ